MNKKAFLLVAFVLLSAMFISGCTESTSIRNTEQVSDAVSNISDNVNDVTTTLNEIDTKLGG